ncbi:MAG: helix-turn-helix domain-containing protein [Bacteroidota bacterium]
MDESFGQYMRRLRLQKGLSQRELARMSGLNHSEISRIEGGSRPTPSPESLAKLAPHLGVAHEDLMRRLGYLSSNPRPSLDEAIRRTLDENEPVRSLVMQLTGRQLSQAGKDFLARALDAAREQLDRMERGHADAF